MHGIRQQFSFGPGDPFLLHEVAPKRHSLHMQGCFPTNEIHSWQYKEKNIAIGILNHHALANFFKRALHFSPL